MTQNTIHFKKNIILQSFPEGMHDDVEKVIDFLNDRELDIHSMMDTNISVQGEKLTLPYRIYSVDMVQNEEKNLSDIQKTILYCLLLRHNNGFIRQGALRNLINTHDIFTIPFKIGLLGEYVIEIVEDLEQHITDITLGEYANFVINNPEYWNLIKGRIGSYWGEYYSGRCAFKEYIGYRLMKKIENYSKARR